MITNIRFELYGLIDTHGMVSVHGCRVSYANKFTITGSVVFTEESCVPRLWQILARLFAQIHVESAIVLEGLHKIFALQLDLCRLTE